MSGKSDPTPPSARTLAAHGVLVVLLSIPCLWVGLGVSGISQSEGHRAIPGWEMLRGGDWLITSMFEQPYLRKPPGMPWAVALSSLLLGETEFAARAVSALATTVGALLTMLYAARWFGGNWGLKAGIAYLLLPLFWVPGRSAEIEALHNTFTLATVLMVIDTLLHRATFRGTIALGLSLAGMILAKGPAGLPCVGAAVCACLIVQGPGAARAALTRLALPAAIGAGVVGVVAAMVAVRLRGLDVPPVLEPPSRFLWRPDRLPDILLRPVAAVVSAMPHGIALLAVPALPPLAGVRADKAGRAAAWAMALGLLFYLLLGVSNPRYVMPALTLAPMVAIFAMCRALGGLSPARVWARDVMWFLPMIVGGLVTATVLHAAWFEHRRDTRTSGRSVGWALGEVLPDGSEVWADDLIDTRPEVLFYARERAAELGKEIRPRWMPRRPGKALPMPPPGGYLALRSDDLPRGVFQPEVPQYEGLRLLDRGVVVFVGVVHKFQFRVYHITDGGAESSEGVRADIGRPEETAEREQSEDR